MKLALFGFSIFSLISLSTCYVYSGTYSAEWIADSVNNVWNSTIDTSDALFNSTPSYFTSLRTEIEELARHIHGHLTILFATKDSFTISLVPVVDDMTVDEIGDIPEGDLILRWIGVTSESEYFAFGVSSDIEDLDSNGGIQFNVSTNAGFFDQSLTLSQISADGWLMNRYTGISSLYPEGWGYFPVNNQNFLKLLNDMPGNDYELLDLQDRNMTLQWINIDSTCHFDWVYDHSSSYVQGIDMNEEYISVLTGSHDVLISLYDGSGTWAVYDTVIMPRDDGFLVYVKSSDILNGTNWHIRWVSLENCPANGICHLCAPCPCNNGTCIGGLCQCVDGWEGETCSENINECETGKNTCSEKEYCQDTRGSYICICKAGWGGENCTDIDECAMSLDNCTENGYCNNTEGSYKCDCFDGWEGRTCSEDKDECLIENICPEGFFCRNINGSYECLCKEEYILSHDEVKCEEPIQGCWTSNIKCSCVDNSLICLPIESYQTCMSYTGKQECSSNEITLTPDGVLVIEASNLDLSDVQLTINGDLSLTDTVTLKKNFRNTIYVSGCVNLSGTLEIDVLGVKDQDKGVIVNSSTNCINGDFDEIKIQNTSKCEQVEFEKQKFEGNFTLLFQVTNTCESVWLYIIIIGIILFFVILILLVLFIPPLRKVIFPYRRRKAQDQNNKKVNQRMTEMDNELSSLTNRTQDLRSKIKKLDNK